MINKIINNYKITSQISEGGMGTVFYGEHLTLNRPVAIKQLHSNLTNNPQFRDRFVNEARILAQLNHPNIITIYDLIEDDGNYYIVMEYIQGDTIDNVMRNMRSAFQLQRALNIFIPTLKAFSYAHSKGIIHRDIKPSNIILDEFDVPKVLDFGIAKILQGDLNLTKAGTKMGSLFYMSPEQVTGNPVDQRSDIYALGVVLYELLTNSLPYNLKTDTEFEIMQAIVNQYPQDISSFRKDIPQNISDVISKACQKDAGMRFSSCQEFESAISNSGYKFVESSRTKNTIESQTSYGNRTIYQSPQQNNLQRQINQQSKSNKNLMIITGIVGFIIIAFLLFFFLMRDNSSDVIVEKGKNDTKNEQKVNNQSENTKSSNQTNQNQQTQKNPNVPGEYPEGSTRYLTDEDVRYKSKYELSIMRNEIFARHGYIFKTNKNMVEHFGRQSWYSPQYYDVTNMLSDIENYNVKFIKKYE